MPDVLAETVLDLNEAAAALQAGGRRPHVSSVWRWCRRGLRGVRLEYARIGIRIVTSREALARFGTALAAADQLDPAPRPAHPAPRRRSPAQRAKDVEAARRELRRAGV